MNNKNFESASVTAERLGVTVRAVQKWAASGKIAGAQKIGRTWFIPKNADISSNVTEVHTEKHETKTYGRPMPLMTGSFEPGKCAEYIVSLPDEDDRAIALGEYYYYTGQPEKAIETAEPYLNSKEPHLRYSAAVICIYANLARGNHHKASAAIANMQELFKKEISADAPKEIKAIGVLTSLSASVLWHQPVPEGVPRLEDYLRYLPHGYRLWGCYLLAHHAYLEKDYSRALAIADMGLALSEQLYPVPAIYAHIVAVMALMSLRRIDEAKKRFELLWSIAGNDRFVEPIAEHHSLLYGMIEVYFKRRHPKEYEQIIAITDVFSAGWREIYNVNTSEKITSLLKPTEFAVAMLYSRGWSAQDIASYMELSESTIRNYIKAIYVKLGVSDRHALQTHMMK